MLLPQVPTSLEKGAYPRRVPGSYPQQTKSPAMLTRARAESPSSTALTSQLFEIMPATLAPRPIGPCCWLCRQGVRHQLN
jgi:hypothetical protein